MSAFGEQVELLTRQEALQKELETVGEDMDAMTRILDELDSLNTKVGADCKRHTLGTFAAQHARPWSHCFPVHVISTDGL
jgi:hypothetical protein